MIEKISKQETKKVLTSLLHVKRNDLRLSSTDTTDYYLLEDGRLLVHFQNADFSTFFGSEKEFKRYMGEDDSSGRHYILEGFPSTQDKFIQSVKEAGKRLEDILRINELNFSFDSLKRIDEAIPVRQMSYDFYFRNLYSLLVPYVSNTIIVEKKANWYFFYNEEENVAEPFIDLPNGKRINVFIDLYEEALEDFEHFSVYSIALLRLDKL